MKKIKFESAHRKKHFAFFNGMSHPHFQLTANVVITNFYKTLKTYNKPLNNSLVYLLSKTANDIKEFRWRIRGEEVVEHPMARPSFTVPTDQADVFSFCTVDYMADYEAFLAEASRIQELMRTNPSFEDEEGMDNYLFMSAIPWVKFTGIQHAMNYHPHDSVPRISWGKIYEENTEILMPVSVQAHHSLVDGRHMGMYFNNLEENALNFKL